MSEIVSPDDHEPIVNPVTVTEPVPTPATDVDWQTLEKDADFQQLIRAKRNFIIPVSVVFLVYYFGFLILVGYFPDAVDVNVIGNINLAYLFALSQFVLAWIIVYLYARRAGTFDRLAQQIVARVKGAHHE